MGCHKFDITICYAFGITKVYLNSKILYLVDTYELKLT